MLSSYPQTPLTSCCFQKIPAAPSLCCSHWSCPSTRGRGFHCHGSRCRGFRCRATRSRSRSTRCSSSPRPPREASGSGCSCGGCAASREGPDRCCRCPRRGGLSRARLGCSHPFGAAAPWSCTPTLPSAWSCTRWTVCTLRLHPGPPELGSDKAWSLNLLTSGGVLPWACSRLLDWMMTEHNHPIFTRGVTGGNRGGAGLICWEREVSNHQTVD